MKSTWVVMHPHGRNLSISQHTCFAWFRLFSCSLCCFILIFFLCSQESAISAGRRLACWLHSVAVVVASGFLIFFSFGFWACFMFYFHFGCTIYLLSWVQNGIELNWIFIMVLHHVRMVCGSCWAMYKYFLGATNFWIICRQSLLIWDGQTDLCANRTNWNLPYHATLRDEYKCAGFCAYENFPMDFVIACLFVGHCAFIFLL